MGESCFSALSTVKQTRCRLAEGGSIRSILSIYIGPIMTFIPGREDVENDERKGGRRLSRGANSAQPPNSSFGTCTSWSGKGRTTVTLRVQVPFFTLTEGKKDGLTIRLAEKRKSSLSNAGSGQGGQGSGKGFQRAALS